MVTAKKGNRYEKKNTCIYACYVYDFSAFNRLSKK